MKYLCLAYGDEKDWKALSRSEQDALLAQDQVIIARGDLVAMTGEATTVRAPGGKVTTTAGTFAQSRAPLAGFSLIEAKSLQEVIDLVSKTPCAVAGGAIEVRPIEEA